MSEATNPPSIITALLDIKAQQTQVPPGISLAQVRQLADEYNLTPREIELQSLAQALLPERYRRNYGTCGFAGQIALLKGRAAVVGAGGLGGFIIEGLARMGVGQITIIDGDVFVENNLNRQLGCTEDTLGLSKAMVLAERVRRINSAVDVSAQVTMVDDHNASELLQGAQVIVDALDNLPSRLVLQHAAQALGVPLVHGAIAGHTGQVMTIYPGDPGLQGLYGDSPAKAGIELLTGNPAATPMLVAAWQVAQTVQLLTGVPVPAHRLFLFDLEYGETTEVHV